MYDTATLERTMETANLPGAAAMIVDSQGTRFSGAWGHADAIAGTIMALDTVCQIASMTKAVVSLAAMQLVEAGRLTLDGPIADVLPELGLERKRARVLTGFSETGLPRLRPAVRPITLRHLLTHTAGLGYSFVQPEVLRYFAATQMPEPGFEAAITMPLLFDPGERWEYGVATDWVGLAIEAVTGGDLQSYLQQHILAPLGMKDTAFRPILPEDAAKVHKRTENGSFRISTINLGGGEFQSGGGGLSSTVPDYARFLRMILRGGELDGARIVSAATIAEMTRNQVGELRAGYMGSAMPAIAAPYDNFPDQHTGWGLGFLINPQTGPNGRSAGSLAWAGIFNSFYWIDPAADIAGVFAAQLAPFGDAGALKAFGALERMAYGI